MSLGVVTAISSVSTAVIGVGEFLLLLISVPVTVMVVSDASSVDRAGEPGAAGASARAASRTAASSADDLGCVLGVAVD
jgi:hypothetical protein